MDFRTLMNELRAMVNRIKDETLVPVDENDPMTSLVNINNEGVNHGVMQMFYKITAELYRIETELIRKEGGK